MYVTCKISHNSVSVLHSEICTLCPKDNNKCIQINVGCYSDTILRVAVVMTFKCAQSFQHPNLVWPQQSYFTVAIQFEISCHKVKLYNNRWQSRMLKSYA